MKKAAIYHFTDKSEINPKIYLDQIEKIKAFAESQGYMAEDVYCDKSLKRCDHKEYARLMESVDAYDAIFTKDYYHICKNTKRCVSIARDLYDRGIEIYTVENGKLAFEDEPSDKPLRVATYNSRLGECHDHKTTVEVQNAVLKLFVDKKTCWTLVDQYSDESEIQRDGSQKELMKLIANRSRYDLLLVHEMNDIHWRTAHFCRVRETLHLDIFSLQEGFLQFGSKIV